MATNKGEKTNRELVGDRLKTKYPDREYSDDEAIYGQINDDIDDYESQLGTYREREKRLNDLFSNDPKSARFITDMANGKDPWIAVIERLGIDGITDLMNDPSKQEEYSKANKVYVDRITKERGYEEEYNKNLDASLDIIEQVQKERGLSDDVIDAAMNLVIQIANDAVMGKFSAETLDMALKALNHDADVDNANAEGVIAGRNEKIEEKLRKPKSGDGLPNMAGKNNGASGKNRPMDVFDLAYAAK